MDKKLLLIANPRAGRGKSSAGLFEAVCEFSKAGYLVSVRKPEEYGDITRIAAEYGSEYDLVVCSGGDGTLSGTISGVMQLPVPRPAIGYIPNGSTNDFALSLGLPLDTEEAARQVLSGVPHSLDLGQFNERQFVYVASFGAFTRASYAAPQEIKNALGYFAYILEGAKDLDTLHPYRMRVETEEEVFEGEYLFGAVSNSTSIAGKMKLSQNIVAMDDGEFELILVPHVRSLEDLSGLLLTLMYKEFDPDFVIVRHVKKVTFRTEEDIPWSLDGEYAPSAPVINIETLHHAYRLILPKLEEQERPEVV